MRLRIAFGVALVSGVAAAFAACGGDEPSSAPPPPGGLDASLGGDVAKPPPDAAVPFGDVCGDASGLQMGAPWPMRGGCPKRAGYASSGGPSDANVKWSVPVTSSSSPAIDASHLIWIGTTDGEALAFRRNGDVSSTFHAGGAIASSAALDTAGHALFTSADGTLYGIAQALPVVDGGPDADAGEGRVQLTKMIGASSASVAIGAGGVVYVGTDDGKMTALSADLSAVMWSVSVGKGSATIGKSAVYVGTDGKVVALDPSNGATKWTIPTGGAVTSPVAVGGDEVVYAGAADGKLYAIDPAGTLKWTYATGGPIKGAPAVLGGTVYVGSDDKKLHAVHVKDGSLAYAFATLGPVATPVVAKDGTAYVGSADGHVYAVTPGGSLYFAVNVKGAVTTAPAVGDDGTLYVTTSNALVAVGR